MQKLLATSSVYYGYVFIHSCVTHPDCKSNTNGTAEDSMPATKREETHCDGHSKDDGRQAILRASTMVNSVYLWCWLRCHYHSVIGCLQERQREGGEEKLRLYLYVEPPNFMCIIHMHTIIILVCKCDKYIYTHVYT